MNIHELDNVILQRDLPEHHLEKGDAGAVVQRYNASCFEVEFPNEDGQCRALITLNLQDIQPTRTTSKTG